MSAGTAVAIDRPSGLTTLCDCSVTRIAPVSWGANVPLDSKSCYLLLVTYQTGGVSTAGGIDSLTLDKLSSAAGCLTPRGLRHAFSW